MLLCIFLPTKSLKDTLSRCVETYPCTDFFCSVLSLGKQIYQIRDILALSDRQPGCCEAAGRGGGGGHHSSSSRGSGLDPNATTFKHRRAWSCAAGRASWPSLPRQTLPGCPFQGAGAAELFWIQGTDGRAAPRFRQTLLPAPQLARLANGLSQLHGLLL